MIKIVRTENFNRQEKKLKRYAEQEKNYNKILTHIKQCNSVDELENHVISKMYGYEALKYELNGYYSFNLCKNRGTIRLIFKIDKENNIVELIYISLEHYEDFKRVNKKVE